MDIETSDQCKERGCYKREQEPKLALALWQDIHSWHFRNGLVKESHFSPTVPAKGGWATHAPEQFKCQKMGDVKCSPPVSCQYE